MNTFISTIAYEKDFKTKCKTGWGCGYVHIPKDHPILVKLLIDDGWGNYLQPDGCPEDITLSEWDKDKEYFIIGFDTAHSYNNDSHNEEFVTRQANFIKSLVDKYKFEDAREFALDQIQKFNAKFNHYL